MRFALILIGAAVVAALLIKGVRAYLAERNQTKQLTDNKE